MKPRRIDEHTLRVLEFGAVGEILSRYAAGELGRRAALELRPSLNARWIGQRMAETTQMQRLLLEHLRPPMSGLHDLSTLLAKCDAGTILEPEQLLQVATTLDTANELKNFLGRLSQYPALMKLADRIGEFAYIVEEINRCVENEHRLADGASDKLGRLRRTIDTLESQIRRKLQSILANPNLQTAIENENILIRGNRPVIAVKKNYRSWIPGLVVDRSAGGATLYIQPEGLVQVSNELEEALYEENNEVGRILWELTRLIAEQRQAIRQTLQTLSFIDLTYAKAMFSIAHKMNPCSVSRKNNVVLNDVRHPLLMEFAAEKSADPFKEVVPISLTLGDDYDLLLLTGPNTGGKTVTLKTVGLAALMHQSGMHIAAGANAEMPIFQRIYADIGDEQSIAQSLSTFSAHMAQIVDLLKGAKDDSLVLLDELGAGTDPAEGAALATAILTKLLKKKARIIATTHLGNLKRLAFSHERASNGSVEFDPRTLAPTYRLRIGEPGTSNALIIAQRLNMPPDVVEQAKQMLGKDVIAEGEIMKQAQEIRAMALKEKELASDMRRQSDELRNAARCELARVNSEREAVQNEADLQVDQAMEQVRSVTRAFMKEMANAPNDWQHKAGLLAEKIEQLSSRTTLAQRRAEVVANAKQGDYVYVRRLQRAGMVVRIQKRQQMMTVAIEGRHIDVPFEQISQPPKS